MKKVVIALGGNAIIRKGEKATLEFQERNVRKALSSLLDFLAKKKVVVTHGNGPAVGYLMIQQECARKKAPVMPLDVLDAETEGQIGYLIQQNLLNLFRKKDVDKNIVSVLTQVLVDRKDKAFRNPTKFVGPFYSRREALKLGRKFKIKEDAGRGWRRVVPSPKPIEIIEADVIRRILKTGSVVIAAGGGGIPVVQKGLGIDGVEAVVDKDLASACLAKSIGADSLIILTDVDGVYMNYRKRSQKRIDSVSVDDLQRHYDTGEFPAGSMGPKVKAAIDFVSSGRKRKAIITDTANIGKALRGKAGTVVLG